VGGGILEFELAPKGFYIIWLSKSLLFSGQWFCVVCRSVSLDCPFFITPSLTGFVLFVVLFLWHKTS
jgi:hypothetical protein